jgi:hypothetical protein
MIHRLPTHTPAAMAVAAVVIVLALINLVVIASLEGGTDDAMSAAIPG